MWEEGTENLGEHRGVLSRVRFQREDFVVGVLDDGTVVRGSMASPELGSEYSFAGSWVNDPRFGQQFAFSAYRTLYPRDLHAIQRYLVQHGADVGPTLSERLVELYGVETLTVCKTDPDRAAREVKGLRPAVAHALAMLLRAREADEAADLELARLFAGLRVAQSTLALMRAQWGNLAADYIREDPFGLAESVSGIGFATADAIATRSGFAPDDPRRLRAGVLYLMREQAMGAGHTCLPEALLVQRGAGLLNVDPAAIESALSKLVSEGAFVRHGDHVAFRHLHDAEVTIAARLRSLQGARSLPSTPQLDGLAPDQQAALCGALECGVFILTGGPGTGKSYTIRRILDSFPGTRVALCAPTGKAAKRMAELSGREAQTIHRLLEPIYQPGSGFVFQRGADNPIDVDVLVVDEVSMVDVGLMARLLEALPDRVRLILVGDADQLPAVGAGNVLGDLIASGQIPCSQLTEIKRQDAGLIVHNCHRIRRGEDLLVDNATSRDFFFSERASETQIRDEVIELVSKRLPERFGADPLRDIQVLVPRRRRTALSCDALNRDLQQHLNGSARRDGARFAVGDKVIQTRNTYELEIFNGDLGTVQSIVGRTMLVRFESPERVVDLDLHRNDLELGYAVTVHKFQGSEARIVVIPIHSSAGPLLLQRAWLYTAVSRAREVCVLVGSRREARFAVRRDRGQRRFTLLESLLR